MAPSTEPLEVQYGPKDIMSLTLPNFSSDTDEVRNLADSPPSLLLRETLGGRNPTAAHSFLLSLPQELLPHILDFLEKSELAQLALVNSDCRQLARIRQFEHLRCDHSKVKLLEVLAEEADQRSRFGGSTELPALGACVRRLTIATSPSRFSHVYGWTSSPDGERFDQDETDRRMQAAAEFHFGFYMGLVRRTIAGALPNINIISWNDTARLDPHTLKAMLETSATHLKLDEAVIDDETMRVIRSISDWKPSKLVSLDAHVSCCFSDSNPGSVIPFMAFLLQQCADSLTDLKWNSMQYARQFKESMVKFPTLPRLQSLSLSLAHGLNPSPSILRSLISPLPACRLVHLEIPVFSDALGKFLDDHGNMPTLKSFVWTSQAADEGWPMQFLSENTQLETLSLTWPPAFLMENQLLPLLRNGFLHLLSLEIGYNESVTTIPGLAFEAVASIKTLEQLHLTAGRGFGAYTWIIDHSAIRRCVKQLPNLKTLALSRDTNGEQHGLDVNHEFYYEDRLLSPEPQNAVEAHLLDCLVFGPRNLLAALADDPEEHMARSKWAWEMIHRRRMLQLGSKYVNLRYKGGPKLEFLYFGQLPMEVTYGWYGYQARAVTEYRDECYTLLQRIFKRKYTRFTGGWVSSRHFVPSNYGV